MKKYERTLCLTLLTAAILGCQTSYAFREAHEINDDEIERQAPWAKPSEDELLRKANEFFRRGQDHFERWQKNGGDIKDLKAAVGLYHWVLKWWDLDSASPQFAADAAGVAAEAHLRLWESDPSQISSLKKAVALYDRAVAAYGEHLHAPVLLNAARSHFRLWEQDKTQPDHLKICLPLYDRALEKYGEITPPAEMANAALMHLSLWENERTQIDHLIRAGQLYAKIRDKCIMCLSAGRDNRIEMGFIRKADEYLETLADAVVHWSPSWTTKSDATPLNANKLETISSLLDRANERSIDPPSTTISRAAALSHFTLWRLYNFPLDALKRAVIPYDRLIDMQGDAMETLDLYHAMICHHHLHTGPSSVEHAKKAQDIFRKILDRNGVHINPEAPEYLRQIHNTMNYISVW